MTGIQALPSSDATKSRIILITPFGMVRTSALSRQTKVFSCWEHDLFDPNMKGSVPDGMVRIAVTPTPNLDPAILANLPRVCVDWCACGERCGCCLGKAGGEGSVAKLVF